MRLDLDMLSQPEPQRLRFRLLTLHAPWGWYAHLYADGRLVARAVADPDMRFQPVPPAHPVVARLAALPSQERDELLRQIVASDLP